MCLSEKHQLVSFRLRARAGCCRGGGQRLGSLLRWLGSHGAGLLRGQPAAGSVLQDAPRIYGTCCNVVTPSPLGSALYCLNVRLCLLHSYFEGMLYWYLRNAVFKHDPVQAMIFMFFLFFYQKLSRRSAWNPARITTEY